MKNCSSEMHQFELADPVNSPLLLIVKILVEDPGRNSDLNSFWNSCQKKQMASPQGASLLSLLFISLTRLVRIKFPNQYRNLTLTYEKNLN